ncbi:MAG: DUF1203 domain-containing protein [Gemmatimonadota bacterium]
MTPFRVIALPDHVAEQVRRERKPPGYGHPAHAEIATGYGPCRVCLRTFEQGVDRRLLFTYDPFDGVDPLPLPSPIFVHESPCRRHAEDEGFPEELRDLPLTLNAYGRGRRLRDVAYVDDGRVEPSVESLLARPDVDYIHVRNTEAGCYILRIEPVEASA